jgi:KipI family sensor histidine kinase inhibitor
MGDRAWVIERARSPTRATLDALSAIAELDDVSASEREVLCVLRDGTARDAVIARIEAIIASDFADGSSTSHRLSVVYDGEDLAAVARAVGATEAQVVRWHSEREYRVSATGFAPGWAYLAEVDERLRVARRPSPRERVAAGSVAIADARTGVYPFDGPGGWSILGSIADGWRAFDSERGAALALGDRVRFEPTDARAVAAARSLPYAQDTEQREGLRIEWSDAPALVQDGGRRGALRMGIARGGALWKGRLALANAALSQRWDAAAIELYGAARVRAEGRAIRLSIDGEVRALRDGEALSIARSERARVRYLALEGGVACTPQLGGRGQLVRAGLGGLDHARGRPLRRGDLISCADVASLGSAHERCEERGDLGALDESHAFDLWPGRAMDRFERDAFERFVGGTSVLSAQSDRTGARLRETVSRRDTDAGLSSVMFAGAIQVSADGTPIVLGVDHPTVGGYPVLAVLSYAQLGPLLARRPGARVRYRLPL